MKNFFTYALILLGVLTCSAQQVSTIFNSTTQQIDDALLLDAQGNLYGSNYGGANVYKINSSGQVSIAAGGLNTPNGLAFDSQGNLFICDNVGNRIYKVDSTGTFLDTIFYTNPSGIIKEHDSDTMIFTTYAGHRLVKLAPDGSTTIMHQGGVLNGPVGLCYDDNNQLFVGNFTNRAIYKVFDDTLVYVAQVPGGSFLGFITYAQGALWGTTFNQHKIYKIIPNAIDSVVLYSGITQGSLDGAITVATFNRPNGILASLSGDTIYISDYGTGNIRMITGITLDNYLIPDSKRMVLLAPNPTKDVITIQMDQWYAEMDFTLVNIAGQRVWAEQGISGTSYAVDMSNLEAGIYFMLLTLDGKTEAMRIVKH